MSEDSWVLLFLQLQDSNWQQDGINWNSKNRPSMAEFRVSRAGFDIFRARYLRFSQWHLMLAQAVIVCFLVRYQLLVLNHYLIVPNTRFLSGIRYLYSIKPFVDVFRSSYMSHLVQALHQSLEVVPWIYERMSFIRNMFPTHQRYPPT